MLEREKSAQVRKDFENIYGNKLDVFLMQDSYGQSKREFDFYTAYKIGNLPLFMAWELKMVTGMTFNKEQVTTNQFNYFKTGYKVGSNKQFYTWSLILVHVDKLNVLFAIDQMAWKYIFDDNKDVKSFKIIGYNEIENLVQYKLNNGVSGVLPACKREKVLYANNTVKIAYNLKRFMEHYYKYAIC